MDFHEYRQLLILANDPNTPPDVLTGLVGHKTDHLWYYLAKNPSTPTEALCKMLELYFNEDGIKLHFDPILSYFKDHPNAPDYTQQYIQTRLYLIHYEL